jgi:hypothetical protein
MQYLLLIYSNEQTTPSSPEIMQEYMGLGADLRAKGQYLSADRLQDVATATTVRVKDGKTITTDGPFAETREQLGGYYLVEAKDLDEAVGIAARIPAARWGSVEVRPIFVFS